MSLYQKPMGIHAVGGTGEQCHQILAGLHRQALSILRLYHLNVIHLIGQCLIQHMNQKMITQLQLIQVCKQ